MRGLFPNCLNLRQKLKKRTLYPTEWERESGAPSRLLVTQPMPPYHRAMLRKVNVFSFRSTSTGRAGAAESRSFLMCCGLRQPFWRHYTAVKCVMPFGDVPAAKASAAGFDRGEAILGGERGGVRIEGVDLDNSPAAMTPSGSAGRRSSSQRPTARPP